MRQGLSERELAYLGGFFDGEGSVGIYPRGGVSPVMSVQVVQNWSPAAEALIRRWQEALGGNIGTRRSESGNAKIQWQANGNTAAGILRAILPYLVLKQEQVELCIQWQENRPAPTRDPVTGRMVRHTFSPEMDAMMTRVKSLKRGTPFVAEVVA